MYVSVHVRPWRGHWFHGDTESCESPRWCWKLNSDPVAEQAVLQVLHLPRSVLFLVEGMEAMAPAHVKQVVYQGAHP